MAFNMELKARVGDFGPIEKILFSAGAEKAGLLVQEDVYFDWPQGRLKIRTSPQTGSEVIIYHRPDKSGPKGSSYERIETKEPGTLAIILSKALGYRVKVCKNRLLYVLGKTRIHLDEVKGLGRFVELEVVLEDETQAWEGKKIIAELRDLLGIEDKDLVAGSYIDLITRQKTPQSHEGG